MCFCPAEGHVFHWCCHLQCSLLLILGLVLEVEVLPTVALGSHRGGAFRGGRMYRRYAWLRHLPSC